MYKDYKEAKYMKKKLNLNELMWFLILLGFTCYFYFITSTGKITLFVHPKMVKYVRFALYFFIVLCIFQGKNIYNNKRAKVLKSGYFMFLIPLILGFFLKAEVISIDIVIKKGFSLTSQLKINTIKHQHTTMHGDLEQCNHDEDHNHVAYVENDSGNNSKENIELVKDKTIVMTNENFIKNYEDIYGNSCNYIGRIINMKGFIYRQEGLLEDEFILSRMLVSCCMADASLVGLLCNYSGESIFTEGTFISIQGILGEREYKDPKNGETVVIPIIKVTEIEKTNKLSNEYIYN
jgi:putative membrane protein